MEPRYYELVVKFNEGRATPSEINEVEKLVESGAITLEDLQPLNELDHKLSLIEFPSPSLRVDDSFYDMLAMEKQKAASAFSWSKFFSIPELLPRLSFAAVALIIGLAGGYWLKPAAPSSPGQLADVTQQLSELKEMMMLSLLEKESATERLKAVSLTQDMGQVSQKVTSALFQTLNEDSNVNVRLAALDALKPYTKEHLVRQELIRSIAQQDSPLVQVALAELMAQLQEKSSVQELQKILKSKRTPDDIKKKIEQSIDVLI